MRLKDAITGAIVLAILLYFIWKIGISVQLVTCVILFLTMVVVIRYTVETNRMRKEMIKQTELSIIPLIAVHSEIHFMEEIGSEIIKLFIKNVGYGVAKNVKIDKLEVKDEAEDITIPFVFPVISAIMVGEKLEINKIARPGGEYPIPEHLMYIGYHFVVQEHTLNITYEDLMGKEFSSKVLCGAKGCKFL